MAKPYSIDLRERVVAMLLFGSKYEEVAERFQVSVSSVSRWLSRHRQAGTVEPAPFGGRKAPILAPHGEKVRALVEGEPDLTLDAMGERLAADDIETSRTALHRFLQSLGLTLKERRSGQPSRIAMTSSKRAPSGTSGKPS